MVASGERLDIERVFKGASGKRRCKDHRSLGTQNKFRRVRLTICLGEASLFLSQMRSPQASMQPCSTRWSRKP